MVQFQLKPRLTQNPCFVSPLRVFPLRLSLQCAGFDFAHDVSIVVLTIGLLCHSYTFYLPMPHTRGLSIHLLFVQNTIYTRNLSMYGLFQKPWFTHCFGLNSSPGLRKHMLCVKAHLPTKQNANSQKKRVFSVSQHHVSCVCFAFPRVLSFTLLVG